MPNRQEVYDAIDSERAYQEALQKNTARSDGKQRSVGDYLTMLRRYMQQADERWCDNPGDDQALDTVRKIAGIAVHCMEDHGAPTENKMAIGGYCC